MDFCNGKTHSGSDDSYDSWSYPCPGPEKCANARHLLRKQEVKDDVLQPCLTCGYLKDTPNHILGCPDGRKENDPVTPATKFYIETRVVMVESLPQSDDPPGRPPYKEVHTVLATTKKEVMRHQVPERIEQIRTIA